MTDTGKVAWLQAMPITCHGVRLRDMPWSQALHGEPMGNYASCTSPTFNGSLVPNLGDGWHHGVLVQKCPKIMVRLDPFFSFDFSSVYQHGWVFDIFWRSGLTFWCSMSFSDCKINKSQVYTIKPQLKDLKPCHVQIGGLPRLNSKASGCGPQPTAHWCLQHLQLKLGSDVSPKKTKQQFSWYHRNIWVFPKIGVPPNHPF